MCLFGYYKYEECSHKVIEVVSHCVECLWKAGMEGQLWVCPEVLYSRHLIQCTPLIWEGKHGYCKNCEITYNMPETVSLRSFNDMNASDVYVPPSSSSPKPFIYTPSVSRSIPELLGVADQVPPHELSDGFTLIFPSNLEIYDPTDAGGRFQWVSQGWFGGKAIGPIVSRFSLRNGMTFRDEELVREAISRKKLIGVFRHEFEKRGMPWERYLYQARVIRAGGGLRDLDQGIREEITRSRLKVERAS